MRARRFLLYALAAVALLSAVGGLSLLALRLESEAEAGRLRQARLDRMRLALWRLDAHLAPSLGRLAGHAYSHYLPAFSPAELYAESGAPVTERALLEPSPILRSDWPDWLRLHFHAPVAGGIASPDVPTGRFAWVTAAGLVRPTRPPDAPARLAALDGWLTPAVRQALRDAAPPLEPTPPPRLARADLDRGRRDQNALLNAQSFTPRQNPERLDNVLRNVGAPRPDPDPTNPTTLVGLSPLRGAWLPAAGSPLILYRVATVAGRAYLQGALVDWPRLRTRLLAEIRDLLPAAALVPVASVPAVSAPGELLSALPVRLDPGRVERGPAGRSGLTPARLTLGAAWLIILLALGVVGVAVVRLVDLGERRLAFVSAVSHELRSPLTAFRMYADLLADGAIQGDDRRQEVIEKLRDQAERLGDLVSHVLEFSGLEHRGARVNRQTLPAADLLEALAEPCRARCESADRILDLALTVPDGVTVDTDPAAVETIVLNLVDNACKYAAAAEDRRVHVSARIAPGVLVLTVSDHGPGVPAAARRRIFEPFFRAEPEPTREHRGIGLGLALAARLAAALGGRLRLAGEPLPGGRIAAVLELRIPAQGA